MLEIAKDLLLFIGQEHGKVKPRAPAPKPTKSLEKALPQLHWKKEIDVAIVIALETPPQRELLERMGRALEKEGLSTRIAAPGELPEQHVIVTRQTLASHPLPRTRMFVIEDVDLYLREPAQRRNLWKEILDHVR
jgi:hypothetical protein